jgi:hypothetical protein
MGSMKMLETLNPAVLCVCIYLHIYISKNILCTCIL